MPATHNYFKKYDDRVKNFAKEIFRGFKEEFFNIARLNNDSFTDMDSFNLYMDNLLKEYSDLETDLVFDYNWALAFFDDYNSIYDIVDTFKEFSKSANKVSNFCKSIGIEDETTLNIYGNLVLLSKFGNFSFTPISNFSFVKYNNFSFSDFYYDDRIAERDLISIQGATYNNLFDALLNSTKNSYIMVTDKFNCVIALLSCNMVTEFNSYYNAFIKPLISPDVADKIENSTFFKTSGNVKFDLSNKSYRAFLKNYTSDSAIISNISVVKMTSKTGGPMIQKNTDNACVLWGSRMGSYLFENEFYDSLDDIPYEFEQKRIGQHLII